MNITTVVDNAMASWMGSGAVAALSYGNKIPSFVAAAGMTALGSAVLPHFSRLVALRDHAAIRHTLSTYLRLLLILAVPATLLFIAGSEWIVRVLFERGAFRREDTVLVTLIQQMYLIQIPFVMIGMLGVRLLVAMSKNHLLTAMAVVNLAVCVTGNLVFMRWLGVSGIALSTSIMYAVSATMIWILVYRSLREAESQVLATQSP
jgi:putative peptidoglycan lipid II flippase